MWDFLTYQFVIYAFIIALTIGLASSFISPFLVLNEQALIADGLAHVSFTGLVIGLLFSNQPLFISIPFVIVMAVIVKYLVTKKKINGDAALGIISTISLSIGLILIHKNSGFNTSVESMLVGNIWTVNLSEIIIALVILLIIVSFVLIFYKKLLAMTFDYKYAQFRGIKTNLLSYFLAIITSALIAVGVKTIGTLLISSFVIFPSLIGMQLANSFKKSWLFGIISSVVAVFLGITFSHFLDIPASSSIVLTYTLLLLIAMFFKFFKKGVGYRD